VLNRNVNSVLDDIWKIPIFTYFCAMRVASKYDMDDITMAITQVIANMSSHGIGPAIARLAFMAGFPAHFSVKLVGEVFIQACLLSATPSADDLKPLLAHPALVAAMIRTRESTLKDQFDESMGLPPPSRVRAMPVVYSPPSRPATLIPAPPPVPQMGAWLLKELESLGFSE
jgi:hypothetical protein